MSPHWKVSRKKVWKYLLLIKKLQDLLRQKVNRFVSSDNIHCKKRIRNVHSHTEEMFFYIIAPMGNPPDTPRKMKMKKKIKGVKQQTSHRKEEKEKIITLI